MFYMLRCLRTFMSAVEHRCDIFSHFLSVILYCSPVWACCLSTGQNRRLNSLIYKVIWLNTVLVFPDIPINLLFMTLARNMPEETLLQMAKFIIELVPYEWVMISSKTKTINKLFEVESQGITTKLFDKQAFYWWLAQSRLDGL